VLFTQLLLISLDSPPESSAMQVPDFQLLLFPALLQSCYLLFACFASCKSAAAALIFFVLFRWFCLCSCLVSLQNANSPDSLPGLTSGKISVILHCYFYPSMLAMDLRC